MFTILVRPLPGVDRTDLLQTLIALQMEVSNARTPVDRASLFSAYNSWASNAIRMLRGRVSPGDLDRLVLTRRYWMLQSMQASTGGVAAEPKMTLLDIEMNERAEELQEAVTFLRHRIERWSRPGTFAVADTSVFYNADKLAEWDIGSDLHTTEPVHLLFPMVVVDELDRLKESRVDQQRCASRHPLDPRGHSSAVT